MFQKDGHIFTGEGGGDCRCPRPAEARGSQGEQLWMAENPPDGAVITYWIRDAPHTLRQRRQDAARDAEQKKAAPRYPIAGGAHG